MIRRRALGLLGLVVAMLCSTAAGAQTWAPRPEASPTTYTFGVPPWQRGQSVDDIRRLYRPMLDYLEQRVGAKIALVSAQSYDDMIEYLTTGKVHFGTISPRPYVKTLRQNPGVRLLLTELSWDADRKARQDSYRGLIVTLKVRTDISSLADLRGKRFAFVTEESTSGFRYPAAILANNGIDHHSDFAGYVFVGSHPRVTDALVAGSVDAGATWDFNHLQAVAKHGDVFRVLHEVAIPNLCIAAHPSMPVAVQDAIKAALLEIDPKLLEGLPTAGYVERPDSFYDVVRDLPEIDR